eukprot:TRINITY_DN2901_c0_g1_i3.p1 TRINITY_DN2901_c0_g1~~TRINITY_DN2901_c0_g1_i3.p1  ORF type:complete len:241 (+),score=50.95 TRINITY_DN2901_c0_g1_i3:304-1026(+)
MAGQFDQFPNEGSMGMPMRGAGFGPQRGMMAEEAEFAVDPNDPGIPNVDEGFVKQQQLTEMIDALSDYYANSRLHQQKLKTARDLTEFGNYDAAGDIMTQLMYSSSATQEDREMFQRVILDAVSNALQNLLGGARRPKSKPRRPETLLREEPPFEEDMPYTARKGFGQEMDDQDMGGYYGPQKFGGRQFNDSMSGGYGGIPQGRQMEPQFGSFGGSASGMGGQRRMGGPGSFLNRPTMYF